MRFSSDWKDFEVIATGGERKLERWGDVILLRPDPQAIWRERSDLLEYKGLNAVYHRSASGGGMWETLSKLPNEWTIGYRDLKFIISPTNFKHTGLFPEQAVNWDAVRELIGGKKVSVLNLFGYTGGATVSAAMAGANVTHVDASKGMVDVCKRNCRLNNLPEDSVRFIVDDCIKFVERELRRGKTYDAIIMDPPSFGRGANGEVWKIETHLDYLIAKCCELLSARPLFFLVNSYTTGLQPTVIKNVLQRNIDTLSRKNVTIEQYEIGLPTGEGIILPAGCSAIAIFKE